MNFEKLVTALERFGMALPEVVRDVDLEDSRWKPPDGAWSILEIVCHLVDEETLDFRERIRSTLADASALWTPIEPERWAVERRYNEGQLSDAVAKFATLRQESVSWLRSLNVPDWRQTHQHPTHGPFRAGDLLASCVAHDALHLRQIAKRFHQLAARDAGEFSIVYAGEWKA